MLRLSFYIFFFLGFCPQFTATLLLLNSDVWFLSTWWHSYFLFLFLLEICPLCATMNCPEYTVETWINVDLIAVRVSFFQSLHPLSFCLLLIILKCLQKEVSHQLEGSFDTDFFAVTRIWMSESAVLKLFSLRTYLYS